MDNYIYFGKRGFYSALANASVQNSDTLTTTNFGKVPANRAFDDGLTEDAVGLEVFVRSASSNASTRGSAFTTDAVTGIAFTEGADATATTSEVGDVTKLIPASYAIASGVIQIRNFSTDGTNGYLVNAADTVIIREKLSSTNTALTTGMTNNQAALFKASNYLGADPVDSGTTAALASLDIDGTALDITKLHFKQGAGGTPANGTAADEVYITHLAGKFKEVCEAMEELYNGSNAKFSNGMYTFTDLISGKVTELDNRLGIRGCHLVIR